MAKLDFIPNMMFAYLDFFIDFQYNLETFLVMYLKKKLLLQFVVG